jgi:predicted MFS family arabinose efflux permease
MTIHEHFIKILEELGLLAVWNSSIDTKLLLTQRFVRLFAYGATTLILVTYLVALGISEERIGLFMTLTLFGDMLISFCLTLIADGLGRRVVLALGAFLMSGSGVIFVLSRNYWILLAAAVFGVISPRLSHGRRRFSRIFTNKCL